VPAECDQCRFPDTVRAEERDDRVFWYDEVDTLEDWLAAKELGDPGGV
jgi:hypothetical protein